MNGYMRESSEIPMDHMEKRSNQSLCGKDEPPYDDLYDHSYGYSVTDDDEPMSEEEKMLVRKIDFFVMPIICIIDLLQVIQYTVFLFKAITNRICPCSFSTNPQSTMLQPCRSKKISTLSVANSVY